MILSQIHDQLNIESAQLLAQVTGIFVSQIMCTATDTEADIRKHPAYNFFLLAYLRPTIQYAALALSKAKFIQKQKFHDRIWNHSIGIKNF